MKAVLDGVVPTTRVLRGDKNYMKVVRIVISVLVLGSAAFPAAFADSPGVAGAAVRHPRLFVTPERVAEIREQVLVPGSHHALAFAALKDRVDNNRAAPGDSGSYLNSYRAREAAMMVLLTEDPVPAREYAQASFDAFAQCDPLGGSGLARGMNSIGMGIAFDWCHNFWTDEQRVQTRQKILEALDAWAQFRHANLGDVRGSNWVAVTRGGELVLLLAAGEEERRAKRYTFLKRELKRHMEAGFGVLGVTQEGIGYTEYPGAFLLPAVYACANLGDEELMTAARTRTWWKMAMYTHSFQPQSRRTLMTGVAGGGTSNEGWVSLLLNLCPAEQLPYFVHWYDRHIGKRSWCEPNQRFDAWRAGTLWALLYYPQAIQAKDPTGVFPAGVADPRGYYFFRNRWRDANDIQVSIMADAHHHGHAWDQPEQLALNLLAWNTRFIGGPSKDRQQEVYSTLLVDGRYYFKGAEAMTGERVGYEAGKDDAYVVVGGGSLYQSLGVEQVQRHLLVDFSVPGNRAVLSTLDRIRSDRQHRYTWQANLGSNHDDDGIACEIRRESGRPAFVLCGRNGSFVKGWVMHPPDAEVTGGDPLRVETSGSTAEIWVVLHVGSDAPPEARIEGEGLDATIEIEDSVLCFDGHRILRHPQGSRASIPPTK